MAGGSKKRKKKSRSKRGNAGSASLTQRAHAMRNEMKQAKREKSQAAHWAGILLAIVAMGVTVWLMTHY